MISERRVGHWPKFIGQKNLTVMDTGSPQNNIFQTVIHEYTLSQSQAVVGNAKKADCGLFSHHSFDDIWRLLTVTRVLSL